ncbi:MAG TPA: hypothetical protein VMG41_16790 [Gemmatimonadales bacterium]|nr:hypothetical protein [Gemmatimonadales bacterium]
MRGLGILIRVVGWLLTPLVAWAASFCGAWLVLTAQARFANPRHAVYAAFAGALLAGVAAMLAWMQLLRRSPRLRHSLHVDREGLPVLDEADEAVEVASGESRE